MVLSQLTLTCFVYHSVYRIYHTSYLKPFLASQTLGKVSDAVDMPA